MPIVRTITPEFFSPLLDSSRLMIILMMNMQITMNTVFTYQTPRENGFRKISSLILLSVVDSNKKQGLRDEKGGKGIARRSINVSLNQTNVTGTELATPSR